MVEQSRRYDIETQIFLFIVLLALQKNLVEKMIRAVKVNCDNRIDVRKMVVRSVITDGTTIFYLRR